MQSPVSPTTSLLRTTFSNGCAGVVGSATRTEILEPLLARGYGVVVADMPGHGRSSGRLTSLVYFASALRAVAAHVGGIHAVIAHSFGAAGTTLTLRDGLNVARVAYVRILQDAATVGAIADWIAA